MRAQTVSTLALITVITTSAPSAAADRMTLEEANQRWAGARCRSRLEITLNDKKPKSGWAWSKVIYRTPEGGNDRVRVWLTEWDRIRARYLGGTLPAGSEFVAVGWGTEKPKGKGTLFLELEHVELEARARVFYGKDWVGKVEVKELAEFERWARLSMFEIVETPGEQLVEVEVATSTASPRTEAAAPDHTGAVELRILGAATEPLSVAPGRTVVLSVTYEVSGLPSGSTVEVLEQRTIVRDGRVLTTLEASVRRGPGTHRSTQSLTVPASVEPGVLELRASIHAAGAESSGRTLFQVESP